MSQGYRSDDRHKERFAWRPLLSGGEDFEFEIGRQRVHFSLHSEVATLPPSAGLLVLLLWARPLGALVVFVIPMLLMLLNVVRIGYYQHAGLDTSSHFTASRNDLGRLYNRLSFNSGYHTAHHVEPSTHWSRLPDVHRRIAARIPEELRSERPLAMASKA